MGAAPKNSESRLCSGFLFIQIKMDIRIILIRHAETSWNRQKRYCGLNDISLSRAGIKQANELRNRLKKISIHKIFSSDMKRSLQTAKILFGKRGIKKIPGLQEMNFGVFEGLTYKQIIKKYPYEYKRWLDNPYKFSVPEGENLKTFKKRIRAAFKKIIASNKNKTIAVVSHGGAISIFINGLLKANDFWAHIPKNATFSVIEYNNGKPDLKLFNR